MNSNGSDDVLLSDTKDISPIPALALPSAGVMAVRTESRLSDFTIMLKLTEGSSAVPYSLWGNARNNPAILRAWDRFSQSMTVTRKALDGVEFMGAGIVDPMRVARKFSPVKNDSRAILSEPRCNLALTKTVRPDQNGDPPKQRRGGRYGNSRQTNHT
jgi:hypothetical protein